MQVTLFRACDFLDLLLKRKLSVELIASEDPTDEEYVFLLFGDGSLIVGDMKCHVLLMIAYKCRGDSNQLGYWFQKFLKNQAHARQEIANLYKSEVKAAGTVKRGPKPVRWHSLDFEVETEQGQRAKILSALESVLGPA